MTLPSTGPLNSNQIADELAMNRTNFVLPNKFARYLAGQPLGTTTGPLNTSALLGKTGMFQGAVLFQMAGGVNFGVRTALTSLGTLFGGTVLSLDSYDASSTMANLTFDNRYPPPNWEDNFYLLNQSLGAGGVLAKINNYTWRSTSAINANTIPGASLPAGSQITATMKITPFPRLN